MTQSLSLHSTRRSLSLLALAGGLSLSLLAPALARQDTKPAPPEAPATPAASDLPDGRALVEQAIDAAGGRKAFEMIEAMSITGTLEIPAMGMSLEIEMHSAPEGKFLFKQIMPGMGEMSIGSDGTVGWTVNPMSGGYELVEGEALDQGMRQANLQKILLRINERYETIETVEEGTFDDEATYKVRLANEDEEQFMYFSMDEHLARAVAFEDEDGGSTLRFKDYESFGDVKLFRKMLISQGGMDLEMNFKEFKLNDTDDAVFAQPDEVKKILEDKAAAEKADEKPATKPDDS